MNIRSFLFLAIFLFDMNWMIAQTEGADPPAPPPTDEPTQKPTRRPTGQPTRQPTSHPTGQPTRQPTSQPTRKINPLQPSSYLLKTKTIVCFANNSVIGNIPYPNNPGSCTLSCDSPKIPVLAGVLNANNTDVENNQFLYYDLRSYFAVCDDNNKLCFSKTFKNEILGQGTNTDFFNQFRIRGQDNYWGTPITVGYKCLTAPTALPTAEPTPEPTALPTTAKPTPEPTLLKSGTHYPTANNYVNFAACFLNGTQLTNAPSGKVNCTFVCNSGGNIRQVRLVSKGGLYNGDDDYAAMVFTLGAANDYSKYLKVCDKTFCFNTDLKDEFYKNYNSIITQETAFFINYDCLPKTTPVANVTQLQSSSIFDAGFTGYNFIIIVVISVIGLLTLCILVFQCHGFFRNKIAQYDFTKSLEIDKKIKILSSNFEENVKLDVSELETTVETKAKKVLEDVEKGIKTAVEDRLIMIQPKLESAIDKLTNLLPNFKLLTSRQVRQPQRVVTRRRVPRNTSGVTRRRRNGNHPVSQVMRSFF
jgi:hypothetical protein